MDDDWVVGRDNHVRLADTAAKGYAEYARTSSATKAYMDFEESVIEAAIASLSSPSLALDLGCGEGRISFLMSGSVKNVVGYDMSQGMVEVARRRQLLNRVGNTQFIVRELESELLPEWPDESVDFVSSSFGMGSFFRHPEHLFEEVARVLKPGGRATFSFYNSDSLVASLPIKDWKPSLAARIGQRDSHGLVVEFGDQSFDISARAYSVLDVRNLLAREFDSVELSTYPTLSAVLPHAVTGDQNASELLKQIDMFLAASLEISAGAYILAVASKNFSIDYPLAVEGSSYSRVLSALASRKLAHEVLEHEAVYTMDDVIRVLGVSADNLLKSVVMKVGESGMVVCILAANRQVDYAALAALLEVKRGDIRQATPEEVLEGAGFKVGTVSPFGLPPSVPAVLDAKSMEALSSDASVWFGSGCAVASIRMTRDELMSRGILLLQSISK